MTLKKIKKQPRRLVNFIFPDALLNDLRAASARTGETQSSIVREGVRREIKRRLEKVTA